MNDVPIALIAAVSQNLVIGHNGKIPWHIAEDLKHFKATTIGYPVIMGRKTWESIGSRPLAGRHNIVVSKTLFDIVSNVEGYDFLKSVPKVVKTLDGALSKARRYLREDMLAFKHKFPQLPEAPRIRQKIFIIGGETLYRALLPKADVLYITTILDHFEGDTFFPQLDLSEWECHEGPVRTPRGTTQPNYRFCKYIRHNSPVRLEEGDI